MGVQLLQQLIAVHTVDLTGLGNGLAAGSGAAQAVHTDLHKIGSGGLIHIQNIANDGLTGHLHRLVLLVLLEHIKNIKHDGIPFCCGCFRGQTDHSYILYPITRYFCK